MSVRDFLAPIAAIALIAATATAWCQGSPNQDSDVSATRQSNQQAFDFKRDVQDKMGIDQNLGMQVPRDAVFTDDTGKQIKFGDLYMGRPLIVMPMFFACKGVCPIETDSLVTSAIQMTDITVGKDYDVVMLSIDPTETWELARSKKAAAVKLYNRPEGEQGFHFLTGKMDQIRKVTDALGFRFTYDPKTKNINHAAGVIFLSPEGKIAGYMITKDFPRSFVKSWIATAKEGKVGQKAIPQLFGCIMVDPVTGSRSLVIENVIRLCAAVFALGVGIWIGSMSLMGKSRKGRPAAQA